MFKFSQLKSIHLEITNRCQASCPMCARNIRGGIENPNLVYTDWTLADYKSIMTQEVINQVEDIYFCGNYGDPVINNELPAFCEYTKNLNPNIRIRIHTNGSIRNTLWWRKLADKLPDDHAVIFGIDGIDDKTQEIYRIGTDYNKIIDNATAFIQSGGNAEWVFIRFQHNQDQVEQARALSQSLGFKKFTVKNTSRFVMTPYLDVQDKNGTSVYQIRPPSDMPLTFIDKKTLSMYKDVVETSVIECKVLKDKEIYIDAHKNLYPCCWLATVPYAYETDDITGKIKKEMKQQDLEILDAIGTISTLEKSVKDIIDSDGYQTVWHNRWHNDKLIMCARTCGVSEQASFSQPKDQIINETH